MDGADEKAPEREPFSARWASLAGIVALALVYMLQAATPLRLDDDALDYLNIATAITDGRPTPNLPIPHGYPWIVSVLERAGMGASAFFVLANCVFLAIGLVSVWMMRGYRAQSRFAAIGATLLAVPVIKSVPMALPDAAFFGVFLFALYLMGDDRKSPGRRAFSLIAASALTLIAIDLRYAGIALVAPLAWLVLRRTRSDIESRSRTGSRFIVIGIPAVFCAVLVLMFMSSNLFSLYVAEARNYYVNASIGSRIWSRAIVLLRSIGEIVVNLPYSRFRSFGWVFLIVGGATIALTAKLVRRPLHLNARRVCLLAYLLLIALWPNPAPRLFIPILPIVVAEGVDVFTDIRRPAWMTVTAGLYGVWFSLAGAAALVYTTRISFSGNDFTHVYGKNGGMPDPDIHEGDPSWPHVQYYRQVAPKLLQRYGDSRARGQ